MTDAGSTHTLHWRSYWRRAPLSLQAMLGDREEEGLAEVLALLRERPAAAFVVQQPSVAAGLQARIRDGGFGLVRLEAALASAPAAGKAGPTVVTVLLLVGPADVAVATAVEAAALGIARACGQPWIRLNPGDDTTTRLDALARQVLDAPAPN
ncbi:MAG: hypothetical protein K0Q68_299 [Moraxellaceae bacterium]|jgi:hypothetical protein|nr:hypothetical protein [Moraxellaceae bacterium]